ncbi:hypothetical protein [Agreia bicolorata]|uniref:Recombination endonuclease VII n=1 Tax=Agreia bicolorata TaxID=110935 RepID=A0ABR5CC38_9MICO|nr:hypothetical protein [Agreia bicolorata]KJC63144.1 hypothetical protein TZ00_15685 [Agreia bicolorata]
MPLTEEQKAERTQKRRVTNALKEEARAHRDEARRQEWCDKGMYLTREQAAAGEACRGCGLPVIDNLGSWPGTMYLTDEQRVIFDADQERYREMHPNCDAHRWSIVATAAHRSRSRTIRQKESSASLPPSPSVGRENSMSGLGR